MCVVTVAIDSGQEAYVAGVGIAPARVLHVVAVGVGQAILERLARESLLSGARLGQESGARGRRR